jgi:hypothetical protein
MHRALITIYSIYVYYVEDLLLLRGDILIYTSTRRFREITVLHLQLAVDKRGWIVNEMPKK